jgi:hypothetical protein
MLLGEKVIIIFVGKSGYSRFVKGIYSACPTLIFSCLAP